MGACATDRQRSKPRREEMITPALLIQQCILVLHKSVCKEILREAIRPLTCRRDMINLSNLLHLLSDKVAPNIDVFRSTSTYGVARQLNCPVIVFKYQHWPASMITVD